MMDLYYHGTKLSQFSQIHSHLQSLILGIQLELESTTNNIQPIVDS